MPQMTDDQLLRRYVRGTDHDAFAELVRRHIGFVHAAARRQTHGDAHLADDVAQAVMIVLARRAGTVAPGAALPSWLLAVTRHAAQNAMKIRSRQRYHERRALACEARVERAAGSPDESGADLREVLDDAIARLPEPDRSGVVLHYLKEQSHAEVGAALGLSAEAARKRVERALDRMRAFLTGRGVVTSGAAIVATLHAEAALAANTVVPAQLVTSTVNLIVLSNGGAAPASSGASLAIAKGVSQMLTLAKMKVAAAVALVVTAVAGATVTPLLHRGAPSTVVSLTVTERAAQAEPKPDSVVQVTPDVKLEFLGLSPFPGDEQSWFTIAGEPIEPPEVPGQPDMKMRQEADYEMLTRVTAPRGIVVQPQIEGAGIAAHSHNRDNDSGAYVITSRFSLQGAADSFSVRFGIATKQWSTVATSNKPQEQAEVDAGEYGGMTFQPAEPDPEGDGTAVEVTHPMTKVPMRAMAFDDAGKEYESNRIRVNRGGDEVVSTYAFDLPPDKLRKVEVQVREFDKFVDVQNISLTRGHKTEPKVEVTEAKKGK